MNPLESALTFGPLALLVLAVLYYRQLLALFGFEVRPAAKPGHHADGDARHADAVHLDDSATATDDRIGRFAELAELEVCDVMVHRTDIRSVEADSPPEIVVREILQSPHTRMPIWRGSKENIVGVVHSKDLLRALIDAGNDYSKIDILRIASKPWFVPDTTTLQDQLNAFLRRKVHFAIVVDEYGEVQGLVTLEDILEEIVGDIADEHDVSVQGVRQEADGSVVVEGSVPIRDLNRAMDWHLPDEEATTIAGLVIHEARSIPERGQSFTFYGFRFQVLRRERNRITVLRITPVADESNFAGSKPRAGAAS